MQNALIRAQSDKDKVETDLLKQQEKVNILESQANRATKDRENLQNEMEMPLDRINKLSEMLDKSRVNTQTCPRSQNRDPLPFPGFPSFFSILESISRRKCTSKFTVIIFLEQQVCFLST